ncbi:MAG: hypothetical protein ACKVW3_13080 [Phycisphaerales bacterium]
MAKCWVALIVDGFVRADMGVPLLARSLIVVAEKLSGVRFEGEVAHMPDVPGSQHSPQTRAAPMPVTSGRYTIKSEPPPPPTPKGKNAAARAEAIEAARLLKPNQWFEWVDAPKTTNCKKAMEEWAAVVGFTLVIYKATSGKVIVKRPGATGNG